MSYRELEEDLLNRFRNSSDYVRLLAAAGAVYALQACLFTAAETASFCSEVAVGLSSQYRYQKELQKECEGQSPFGKNAFVHYGQVICGAVEGRIGGLKIKADTDRDGVPESYNSLSRWLAHVHRAMEEREEAERNRAMIYSQNAEEKSHKTLGVTR